MKKIISIFIVLLISLNLFCLDSVSKTVDKQPPVFEAVSEVCSLHYAIYKDEDGKSIVRLTDDSSYGLEIRVLFDDINSAFDNFIELENQLFEDMDTYNENLLLLKRSPIMYLISNEGLTDILEDEVTGKYYYLINNRQDDVSYESDDYDEESDETVKSAYYDNCVEYDVDGIVTLTVLDYQDATAPSSFSDNRYIWELFEETFPTIKLEREPFFGDPFYDEVNHYVNLGQMPDVFIMWPGAPSSRIHNKKLAKDLTPLLKRDGLYDFYTEACVNPDMQESGYLAMIPINIGVTNCTLVNTKVLDECGLKPAKTYEELKAQLPILEAHGKELITMANEDDWVMGACLFSMIVGRYAGPYWADDIKSGKAKFTNPPFKTAVEMIQTMYQDGVLSQMTLCTQYSDVPQKFANEEAAYLIDGDWRADEFLTNYKTGVALIEPNRQKSDIEFIQFPALPGEVYPYSNSGTLGVGYGMSSSIPEGSAKEAAAWELLKWLSGPEIQQYRINQGYCYPSLKDFISFDAYEPIIGKRGAFYNETKSVTPIFDKTFSSNVAIVANAKLQELGLGKVSVDEVCEAIQAAYEAE